MFHVNDPQDPHLALRDITLSGFAHKASISAPGGGDPRIVANLFLLIHSIIKTPFSKRNFASVYFTKVDGGSHRKPALSWRSTRSI